MFVGPHLVHTQCCLCRNRVWSAFFTFFHKCERALLTYVACAGIYRNPISTCCGPSDTSAPSITGLPPHMHPQMFANYWQTNLSILQRNYALLSHLRTTPVDARVAITGWCLRTPAPPVSTVVSRMRSKIHAMPCIIQLSQLRSFGVRNCEWARSGGRFRQLVRRHWRTRA